jgi:hypothetical protein
VPRPCTVCQHPERPAIEGAVVAGESAAAIAAKYRVSDDAISRHSAAHLPATLARAAQAVAAVQIEQQADALDVMAELRRCFERVNLVAEACDRWLRDPEEPSRYDVGPRAGDVLVIYLERDAEGKAHQRKAPLDTLLARLIEHGLQPVGYEVKHADPRELMLKAVAQLRPSVELLAKLVGELDDRPIVNVTLSPEWQRIRGGLLEALGPYPEARRAAARRLAAVETA